MRRSELDQDGMYCYEQPDGDLILSARPAHKIAVYLDCRIDEDTGDLYTCFANVPKRPMKNDPPAKPTSARRNARG